jgi:ribonuclease BN (tRNA processing enzyme)
MRPASLFLILTAIATRNCVGASVCEASDSAARGTRIVLLGTGTPNADPNRSGPATAIVIGKAVYLIDAGPGIVRRAAAAERKGVSALAASNLTHVFITHLHSDHTLGYPDLIFSPWTLGRAKPLEAFGPPGLESMTSNILEAFREDIDVRLNGGEPANREGYKVHVHEISAGTIYRDSLVTVDAFSVPHGAWKHSFGFKFTTAEGVVVISGDTGPFDGLAEIAKGADVLIHEAYSTEAWKRREPEWQAYHSAFHTGAKKVGEIARRAGVGTVILSHQLFWSATEDDLIKEVKSEFRGRVISGNDLDAFELSSLKKK